MNRVCLKCRNGFESKHKGNRLCDVCRAQNDAWVSMSNGLSGINRLHDFQHQQFLTSIGTEVSHPREVSQRSRRPPREERADV